MAFLLDFEQSGDQIVVIRLTLMQLNDEKIVQFENLIKKLQILSIFDLGWDFGKDGVIFKKGADGFENKTCVLYFVIHVLFRMC